jgi:hypothetical protein
VLRTFGPKQEEVTGCWEKLYNEEAEVKWGDCSRSKYLLGMREAWGNPAKNFEIFPEFLHMNVRMVHSNRPWSPPSKSVPFHFIIIIPWFHTLILFGTEYRMRSFISCEINKNNNLTVTKSYIQWNLAGDTDDGPVQLKGVCLINYNSREQRLLVLMITSNTVWEDTHFLTRGLQYYCLVARWNGTLY